MERMLTTVDNPWNPFTHYDEWNAWDTRQGYHTNGLLARIIVTSNELSDADQEQAYEEAVDEIVEENWSGVHTAVTRDATSTSS